MPSYPHMQRYHVCLSELIGALGSENELNTAQPFRTAWPPMYRLKPEPGFTVTCPMNGTNRSGLRH